MNDRKTSLGLNQWKPSDKPLMTEFNSDNRIIDEKLRELSEKKANGIVLTEVLDVYVSKDGSDNGEGTETSPFLTVTRALLHIEKYLGHHGIRVYIDDGIYEESSLVIGNYFDFNLLGKNGPDSDVTIRLKGPDARVLFAQMSNLTIYDLKFEIDTTTYNEAYFWVNAVTRALFYNVKIKILSGPSSAQSNTALYVFSSNLRSRGLEVENTVNSMSDGITTIFNGQYSVDSDPSNPLHAKNKIMAGRNGLSVIQGTVFGLKSNLTITAPIGTTIRLDGGAVGRCNRRLRPAKAHRVFI